MSHSDIAFLIPQTNTMVETDICRLMGQHPNLLSYVHPHFSRIKIKTRYKENKEWYLNEVYDNLNGAAQLFGTLDMKIYAFMCTSSIIYKLTQGLVIQDNINGIPMVNPIEAVHYILHKNIFKKMLIVSPYDQVYTDLMTNEFQKSMDVVESIALHTDYQLPAFSNQKIIDLIEQNLYRSMDIIYIPCTNFDSSDTISYIESKYKNITVINSNYATIFYILERLGLWKPFISNIFKQEWSLNLK